MHRIRIHILWLLQSPNSCLRTECIGCSAFLVGLSSPPNSCLRTECIHALHEMASEVGLPTHVSARNASSRLPLRLSRIHCSQLMSPHGMHQGHSTRSFFSRAPNSCLRTECITRTIDRAAGIIRSQLMSPHGMHRCRQGQLHRSLPSQLMSPHGMHRCPRRSSVSMFCSQLMSPHGMHQSSFVSSSSPVTPNSCLRTECIICVLFGLTVGAPPNSCLRTECIVGLFGGWSMALLPTHVSARNASPCSFSQFRPDFSPNSCLRTECIKKTLDALVNPSCSQLMSPHGMHPVAASAFSTAITPNSCLRTECIHLEWGMHLRGLAPNSCLRTECISKTLQEMSCMYGINIHN